MVKLNDKNNKANATNHPNEKHNVVEMKRFQKKEREITYSISTALKDKLNTFMPSKLVNGILGELRVSGNTTWIEPYLKNLKHLITKLEYSVLFDGEHEYFDQNIVIMDVESNGCQMEKLVHYFHYKSSGCDFIIAACMTKITDDNKDYIESLKDEYIKPLRVDEINTKCLLLGNVYSKFTDNLTIFENWNMRETSPYSDELGIDLNGLVIDVNFGGEYLGELMLLTET